MGPELALGFAFYYQLIKFLCVTHVPLTSDKCEICMDQLGLFGELLLFQKYHLKVKFVGHNSLLLCTWIIDF